MKLVMNEVRVAFARGLLQKEAIADSKPAFQARCLIPKTNTALVAKIKEAEDEVALEKWGVKAENIMASIRANDDGLLKDGDKKTELEGFADHWFVNVKSDTRPTVVNPAREPIVLDDGIVYSGCVMNVHVEVWAQDNKYGKKVNCQVTGAQFVRDADAFTGSATPDKPEDFADLSASDSGDDLING